jgi:4-diphosphocytidyl-2-C-methyl-D-erythritol kinase
MADRVTIAAHAKANLFLRVLAREASGFHTLETLFTLLELSDELHVERTAGGIDLAVDGADTGPVEENLAYRAATLVLDATARRFGVRIHLTKRIPVRAGLGGGSSDGAATLHAVNRLADDAVPRHEILQFAARLGSDVPFFAAGVPLALAWGRGERIFRVAGPAPAPALIAIPPFGIDTKEAYALLARTRAKEERRGTVVLDDEAFETWGGIGRLSGNDFEGPVFGREPELRELFEGMAQTQPLLVRLCGSGSAVVAVYRSEADRDGAMLELGTSNRELIATWTRSAPAPQAS